MSMWREENKDVEGPMTERVVLWAIVVGIILATIFGGPAQSEEPQPLPELQASLVVVYVNCGVVTDIMALDRGGWLNIEASALVTEKGYESVRELVETMHEEYGQAWAVRETSDCQGSRL